MTRSEHLALKSFVDSTVWKDIFVPYFEDKIKRNKGVKDVKFGDSDHETISNLKKQLARLDVYTEVMRMPQNMLNHYDTEKKGGKK